MFCCYKHNLSSCGCFHSECRARETVIVWLGARGSSATIVRLMSPPTSADRAQASLPNPDTPGHQAVGIVISTTVIDAYFS